MSSLITLVLITTATFVLYQLFTLQAKAEAESAKSKKRKQILDKFFKEPAPFVGNYQEHKDLLKALQECSQDEVTEYYQKLRYKTGEFLKEFEQSSFAPLFEDVAFIYYQKNHPDLEKADAIEKARKDFNFLCRK
ncbi:MAG TPA: hypothetical protein V6D28_15950 [Leptolyngbyaceae cyanobacterium]